MIEREEKQKLIESYVSAAETGRQRKYYRVKKSGTRALAEHRSQWMLVHSTLQQLWEKRPCTT